MDGVESLLLLIWLCLAFGDFGCNNKQELRDIAKELREIKEKRFHQ